MLFNTPLATDIFSRTMVNLFDENQIIGLSIPFQAFFGDPVANGSQSTFQDDADLVESEIIRGNEKSAALITRGEAGINVNVVKSSNEENWTNFTREFPLIRETGDITAKQILKRMAGENPFNGETRFTRIQLHALKHIHTNIRKSVIAFERLASQSILEGKMVSIFGTTNSALTYDFKRKTSHFVTVGTVWSDPAADVLGDFDNSCDLIRQDGHMKCDMAICGGLAINGLLQNTKILEFADNRGFGLVQISDDVSLPTRFNKFVGDGGFEPIGKIRTLRGRDIWLFTSNEFFEDDAGSPVDYMPTNQVLITSSRARADRHFGPSDILPPSAQKRAWFMDRLGFGMESAPMPPNFPTGTRVVEPAMFHHDGFESPDSGTVTIRTDSAPIFVPVQTDAYFTLTID